MTKFALLVFKVSFFAMSQSHDLRSSSFAMSSSDLRLLSSYRIFASVLKLFATFLEIVILGKKKQWTQYRPLWNTKSDNLFFFPGDERNFLSCLCSTF